MSQHKDDTTRQLILVLEDDPNMRECFHALFEHLNYTVVAGSNGYEGVYLLQKMLRAKKVPDLIVTDVIMDEMDGFQFLKTIQAEPPWSRIPVVLVSGMVDRFSKVRHSSGVLKSGQVTFLPKPFEIQELLSAIARVTPKLVSATNAGQRTAN